MNKAQATVRMAAVQTNSILEIQLREAARQMLVVALRAEADEYIKQAVGERDQNGRQLVVGNGLSQERTLQTSVGTMHIRQPRVDDGREGYHFTSAILPRYVRRTMNIDAMVATL